MSYERAVALRQSGDLPRATAAFHGLLQAEPENAELWFQLGLAQRAAGDTETARTTQRKALALDPAHHDARLELARLAYWRGDLDLAGALVTEVIAALPDYQDAHDLALRVETARRAPPSRQERPWQLDISQEHSTLQRRPQPDWQQTNAELGLWLREDMRLHLRRERSKRFGLTDRYTEFGLTGLLSDNATASLAIGSTRDPHFSPEWRLKAAGALRLFAATPRLGSGWLTMAVQHDHYPALDTTSFKPGFRHLPTERWAIHSQLILIRDAFDDWLTGWSVRVDWQTPAEGLDLYAGLSRAPESEAGQNVITRAGFGGLRYALSPRLNLNLSYAREDRANSYLRQVFSSALSLRF